MTAVFFRSVEPASGWDAGRAAVAASQRGRMLYAVTRAVVEKGYAAVTVADVVSRAGVSRRTFYEQFDNKESCFLAAYEAGTQAVIGDIRGAIADEPPDDWREMVRRALTMYANALAAEPDFARVFTIDVLGAGPKAVERRRQVYDLFVEQWRALAMAASRRDSAIGVVPDLTLRALVGGIAELVQHHILTEGAETLGELAPVLGSLSIQVIEGAGAIASRRAA